MGPDTFRSLLHDGAHWEFELFVGFLETVIIDVFIVGVLWPILKKHWDHHIERDKREAGADGDDDQA